MHISRLISASLTAALALASSSAFAYDRVYVDSPEDTYPEALPDEVNPEEDVNQDVQVHDLQFGSCYDAGIQYAQMTAAAFCGQLGILAKPLIPPQCVDAAVSGCKNNVINFISQACGHKLAGANDFGKFLIANQQCQISL